MIQRMRGPMVVLTMAMLSLLALPVRGNPSSEVSIAPNVSLRLQGIALAQELRSDYYIGAIYLPEWSPDLAQAASETVPKRMSMKVLADRMSAREFQRHWKERIALNNARLVWQPQGERILKLANSLRDNLQRGDRIDFDFVPGQGTSVRLNGQLLITISGDGFYPLLLSAWLGDIPPTKAFQSALRGEQDSDSRASLLLSLDSIVAVQRPLQSVAVLAETAEPASAVVASKPVVAKAPAKAAAKAPAPTVVASSKPAPSTTVASATATTAVPPVSAPVQTESSVVSAAPVAVPVPAEVISAAPVAMVSEPASTAAAVVVDEDLLLGEYKRDALQHIRKQLEYPARAWRLGLTGSGVIRARIGRDGALLGHELVVATGQMILDNAMVTMLQRSLPLPALPTGVSTEELSIDIPVDFVR